MKELQPVNQQVILDLSEEKTEQKTSGGIIIPDSAKEKPKMAKILAMSKIENAEVSIGDIVLFRQYSGHELDFAGRKYLILPYSDIMAKIVETELI